MLPLKTIVEGLLFAADGPISLDRLLEVIEENISRDDLERVVEGLINEYDDLKRAFSLSLVAGGYQFRTKPDLAPYVLRLKKKSPQTLSRSATETLAIIAYRQPILRAELEKIRGVDSGGVIRALMEKNLVRVVRREDNLPGHPMLYGTTPKFLETYGLADLKSLPTIEEMEKLLPRDDWTLF
ncbi:MAG: SMC-Scp complex subunit ScpB [Deltaproteobacteria bacterium]|jgi:segregation and condensation protein B|nr:SMC-Scp complex subunit ScpB [Deltaproteobacteria bacterium]